MIAPDSRSGELTHPKLREKESIWTVFGKSFKLCRLDSQYLKGEERIKKYKVNFNEDSDKVSALYKMGIKSFMEEIGDNYELTLEAHADQCGSESYNKNLATRRADNVEFEILKDLKKKHEIKRTIKGEENSIEHSSHDRYVQITAKIKNAGIVLIDNSYSFQGRRHSRSGILWHSMPGLKFRSNVIVYVVRDPNSACFENLREFTPTGENLFKHAQYILSQNMEGDFFVSTYTDGGDPKDEEICQEKYSKVYRNRKYPRNATLADRRRIDKKRADCKKLKKHLRDTIKPYSWDKNLY